MRSISNYVIWCLLLFCIACSKSDNELLIDEDFAVEYATSYSVENSNLKIEFVDVIEDSRCPTKVLCAWAGRAVIKIDIKSGGSINSFELTAIGDEVENNDLILEYDNLRIAFIELLPYPQESVEEIDKEDYLAIIRISEI